MWEQIPMPEIKSTIRACSVPSNGDSLAIWTDEGVFRVRLHPSPTLFRMYTAEEAENHFQVEEGRFVSHGNNYFMHGDCGRHGWRLASNLRTVHPHGFIAKSDVQQNRIQLFEASGNVCLTVEPVNVKSGLLIAHFSSNFTPRTQSSYFVVYDSTSLWVYVYSPKAEGIPSKWSESGSRETQKSLWNAIIEYPDDDTPRLIYADWLEENGDRDRAEFIRLQCRIAERESREFIPPEDPDLVLNEQIQNQHGERWAIEFGEIKGVNFLNTFWRGFPQCSIRNAYLATRKSSQQTILATTPFEFINLDLFGSGNIDRIEKCELTSRMRNITIHCASDDVLPIYSRLLQSLRLNGLRKVSFTGWFGQELNHALITNGPFPQLHTIDYQIWGMDEQLTDFSVLGGANSLPGLKNVIFFVDSSSDQWQERDDIRKLASRVENVYLIYRNFQTLDDVARIHA